MISHRRLRLVTLGVLIVLATSSCIRQKPLDLAALSPKSESTKIFAADGTEITTLRQEENREVIPLDRISQPLRDAVIAIEDARFRTHRGFDARAIIRAFFANARSGRVVEGGSTITQQLVRNALPDVGKERSVARKLREASYAYELESRLSKDKILELYLNTIYFGQGAYGVQAAAQTYFGKDAKDVSLTEGALLAGLIKAPVGYDPYANADRALGRRNYVLGRMAALGLAPEPEVAAARRTELGVRPKVETRRYPAPYFVDYVTRQIQHSGAFTALGESVSERANRLFRGGLRIHTTLDRKAQAAAEEAIARVLDRPDRDPSAALVAIDPRSGQIKAIVGGRDFFAGAADDPCVKVGALNDDGSPKTCAKVNLALGREGGGSGRQSGSAFKPFVLAAALTKGKHLSDVYPADSCIDIPGADAGGAWHVCNYEDSDFGSSLTVREATIKSVNVVYAQMIMDVGAQEVIDVAKRMGVRSSLTPVPSAALGANAVSPLEMASAFGAFPMQGVQVAPVAVTKITNSVGKTLWKALADKQQVLGPGVAYLSTQTLQDVIERGTASRNGKIGRPAFGKTGTAQEWRDAWFVGGAGTDLVAAVAVFWPDGEIEMKPGCGGTGGYVVADGKARPPSCRPTRIRVSGGTWPTQIWQQFMTKALEGVSPSDFPVPEVEIVKVPVDARRGCRPNPYTPPEAIRTETFVKGSEPTATCKDPNPQPQPTAVPNGIELFGHQSGRSDRRVVPSVEGLPERQAVRFLQSAGFRVKIDRSSKCEVEDSRCLVRDQDPEGGTEVPQGSEVEIEVKRTHDRDD
ncbi:MAG: penicillin-binding protein [Actinomycetota bacterium]